MRIIISRELNTLMPFELFSQDYWLREIAEAITTVDPSLSNRRITLVHYRLSQVLREVTGADAGANFHTWAVWGSRKAGVTIRQEDLAEALRNATVVSGIVGFRLIIQALLSDRVRLVRLVSKQTFLIQWSR